MDNPLVLDLLLRSGWFNDAIAERMQARGFEPLSRSQAFVMAQLQNGPARPAALARRLGVSRQAVQQLLRPLTARGLVEVLPDPDDGRATLVHPTVAAIEFGMAAAAEHGEVERLLESRIGRRDLDELRRILARDWGSPER
jgi:DNA-binding MarR family transcriptional regulator